MKNNRNLRLLIVFIAFALGIWIEYLWLGSDAFGAFGIILSAFFVAPIFLLLIYFERRFSAKTKK
ncbi:hypothetical protein HYS42_00960 [Candidatus Saccharibacteria bacterium]|nr:hypothetical protein [Candidatus Saccharibacteria bacterium]